MSIKSIEQDFIDKVSAKIRVLRDGRDRFRVFTPFRFDDGDHITIVLKKEQAGWMLSDEGHTYMHLTYDISEKKLFSGTRHQIILNALSTFKVEDRFGELIFKVRDARFGDALYSFAQALVRIGDVLCLSTQNVQSTFMDDFQALLYENVPVPRMNFNWSHPDHDPEGIYTVDCRINGMPKPLLVYALHSNTTVRDATIALQQFKAWEMPFRSLAVFQNQQTINRKVLARFNPVCEKQFPSLDEYREDIGALLYRSIMNASDNSKVVESV